MSPHGATVACCNSLRRGKGSLMKYDFNNTVEVILRRKGEQRSQLLPLSGTFETRDRENMEIGN